MAINRYTAAGIQHEAERLTNEARHLADQVSRLTRGPTRVPTIPTSNSGNSERSDRFQTNVNSRFYVEINGMNRAVFSEISGLQIETETLDIIEGGVNDRIMRLPVRSRVGNITLKRGITVGAELLNWHLRIVQGVLDLRNVTVTAYNTRGDKLMVFNFQKAYPVKWSGPQFAANGETVAVETLELAHEGTLNLSSS
ncbi:phage tail protein [Deinococcus maricopensis]|uniref:Phage tail protein n=1 Tax=Deinococcus maricopensis (strain DSM 21211 / LMG 22137 / NRRL B-23946 / LB-34) TaxID=709986 RepID=E8U3N4_DEIML|nr:phage tail protein [Deinococcus maricopensis]ADV68658.1 Conserved hypothetical protein CHP02241, phage tail region protein [Deinococcus maricopensis DSM 21211]